MKNGIGYIIHLEDIESKTTWYVCDGTYFNINKDSQMAFMFDTYEDADRMLQAHIIERVSWTNYLHFINNYRFSIIHVESKYNYNGFCYDIKVLEDTLKYGY